MSAPIRFIGLALFAWVGVRAASLGLLPGMTALVPPAAAQPVAGAATAMVSTPDMAQHFAAPDPAAYPASPYAYQPAAYAYPPPYPPQIIAQRPTFIVPAGWAPQARYPDSRPSAWEAVLPTPAHQERFAELEPFALEVPAVPTPQRVEQLALSPPPPPKLDRLALSSWALLRNGLGNAGLVSGGTLGGSQVGARLSYKFTPQIAASLRFSSSAGGVRGAEAAAGVRWQPFKSVPLALNVERREGLGRFGGRSAFAAFVEGGLYQQPVALGFNLDSYAQAGVVGVNSRDWFADGSAALTRPIWRGLSGGLGMWAGGQSNDPYGILYRVDGGPRLSLALKRNLKVHLDYRQRLAGDALPQSGPALTLAGDF